MGRLPAGVVVITARVGDEFRGLTASSLVSISLEPPMVLVGLERASATRAAILETMAFNASLLTRSQEFLADRFSDICVGEVQAAAIGSGDPLILWDRAFWTLH